MYIFEDNVHYKFRIMEFLSEFTSKKRRIILKELALQLNLSAKTIERILYAKPEDLQDVSGQNLIRLSKFFNVQPKEMYNWPVKIEIGTTELILPKPKNIYNFY